MTSKRKGTSSTSSAKRQRVFELGAPTEDDKQFQPTISSSGWSVRTVKRPLPMSLGAMAARVFAKNLSALYDGEHVQESIRRQLQLLPETIASRLFAVLKEVRPRMLSHAFITAYFLRGDNISLSNDLTQVNKHTIQSISRAGESLRRLELRDLAEIGDATFASIFQKLPHLEILVLRGCTKVSDKTVNSIALSCPLLKVANLSYTTPSTTALTRLLTCCTNIEILKLAGVPKLTASFLGTLGTIVTATGARVGSKLRTLKLRLIKTLDIPFEALLLTLPHLTTLDVSFTDLQHLPTTFPDDPDEYPTHMSKLSLLSTPIKVSLLPPLIARFSHLRTLSLGALGGQSTPTLRDDTLEELTLVLRDFRELENISLVGNAKLGFGTRGKQALASFVKEVGRRCLSLSLASIPMLKSSALEGLLPQPTVLSEDAEAASVTPYDSPSTLRDLNICNTAIGDEAVPYIASCTSLSRLVVSGTKFSSEGIMEIIDGCTLLEHIDLTACRGVKITDRRRFFEVREHLCSATA
ncbi:hypothetical protein BS47DRAFT_954172 [Hydnum rufescens UP504]|uniref:RNI-like protein n=1 Tax=Hydnum rufescens UP504 TaxID=1448309 RepID=A0A9P6AYB1_9AGAM|nr:hypothetical protein BS47DRAFT_954172 [Hydnum rufescens UP504]